LKITSEFFYWIIPVIIIIMPDYGSKANMKENPIENNSEVIFQHVSHWEFV